jgi:hypothetical protein
MKKSWFEERFAYFHRQQSIRTSNQLHVLKFVARQLSMDFNVSCYSVVIRALHLCLIDQEQLDDLLEAWQI